MKLFEGRKIKSSPMENKIAKYISNFRIQYIKEATSKTLLNPKTGHNLYFDFYFPRLKLIIEYDGDLYHYDSEVLERDKFKEEWAKLHGFKLIRFSKEHNVFYELGKIFKKHKVSKIKNWN